MQRRSFMGSMVALASGLLVPWEPERVYSFVKRPRRLPGLRLYAGTAPTNADAALSAAVLLSEMTITPATAGEWTGRDFSADAMGRVSFGRIINGDGETMVQLSGQDLRVLDQFGNRALIVTGSDVSMRVKMDPRLSKLLQS